MSEEPEAGTQAWKEWAQAPLRDYERRKALAEERFQNEAVSAARKRPHVLVTQAEGSPRDVTEEVVLVLDALYSSGDWGSGFYTEELLQAWELLAGLLKFDEKLKKVFIERYIDELYAEAHEGKA